MNIAIIYSSITGNTAKLANSIADQLKKDNHNVFLLSSLNDFNIKNFDFSEIDLCLIGFWVRKGYLDDYSSDAIKYINNKNIAFFGTACAYNDSIHVINCQLKIAQETSMSSNKYLGIFMCQGGVPISRTEKRMLIKEGEPHYLDTDGVKRHLEASKHPDSDDLEHANIWAKRMCLRA